MPDVLGFGNVLALAEGFRNAVRGKSVFRQEAWSADRLGPLLGVVRRDHRKWRPDYMSRARAVLRKVLDSALGSPGQSRVVAAYWGLDSWPFEADEALTLSEQAGVNIAEKLTPNAVRLRLSRYQQGIAEGAINAGAFKRPMFGGPEPPSSTVRSVADAVVAPLWELSDPRLWPEQGEGEWLARRLLAYVRPEQLPGQEEHQKLDQALQLLRRRVEQLLGDYLKVEPHASEPRRKTTTRGLQHLQHCIEPAWYGQDRLDLRGGFLSLPTTPLPGDDRRTETQRSQAALASMFFYDIVHRMADHGTAIDGFIDARAFVHDHYAGAPAVLVLPKPSATAGATLGARPRELIRAQPFVRGYAPKPPAIVDGANPAVRNLFQSSLDIRKGGDAGAVDTYIRERKAIGEQWKGLSLDNRHSVLFADHGVHFYVAGKTEPAFAERVGDLDELLTHSSEGHDAYRAFVHRDRSITAAKSNSLSGLERSVALLYKARQELDRARSFVVAGFDRDIFETRHQLDLLTAGTEVKISEKVMSDARLQQPQEGGRALIARVRSPLRWANSAYATLGVLETAGLLVPAAQRYANRHLADASWNVQTRIIRLRCLCAEYTLIGALELQSERSATLDDIDVAYRDLVTTADLRLGDVPLVLQLVLWAAMLNNNSLPHVEGQLAVALRDIQELSDFLPQSVPGDPRIAIREEHYLRLTEIIGKHHYNCGAIERVDPGSRVGVFLNSQSSGQFGVWRRGMDTGRPDHRGGSG